MCEVRGICHTNLDEYKREQWPTKFCQCPDVGTYIRARSGRELRVIRITHSEASHEISEVGSTFSLKVDTFPQIEVELHK